MLFTCLPHICDGDCENSLYMLVLVQMNHYPYSKVLLLKQTNVRIVSFAWFVRCLFV